MTSVWVQTALEEDNETTWKAVDYQRVKDGVSGEINFDDTLVLEL